MTVMTATFKITGERVDWGQYSKPLCAVAPGRRVLFSVFSIFSNAAFWTRNSPPAEQEVTYA
jgi:hypothetical protein